MKFFLNKTLTMNTIKESQFSQEKKIYKWEKIVMYYHYIKYNVRCTYIRNM